MNTFRRILSFALFAAFLPFLVIAQEHPATQRGFAAEKAFAVGDLDHVSLQNGNLILTLPLGPSYQTSGGFSYQLTLAYNGGALWDYSSIISETRREEVSHAEPTKSSNAGFGWRLSLGELINARAPFNPTPAYWVYRGADGSDHTFYPNLHETDPVDPVDPLDPVPTKSSYTRDGSYLRLQVKGAVREVHFPNGQVHRFRNFDGNVWRLEMISDPFENWLKVAYTADSKQWTLSDNWGRKHDVHFKPSVH